MEAVRDLVSGVGCFAAAEAEVTSGARDFEEVVDD